MTIDSSIYHSIQSSAGMAGRQDAGMAGPSRFVNYITLYRTGFSTMKDFMNFLQAFINLLQFCSKFGANVMTRSHREGLTTVL